MKLDQVIFARALSSSFAIFDEPGSARIVEIEARRERRAEKKRKGRAPTEGEPLKRVLIFLSDDDITRLKSEVGERAMSTKVREIIKAHLAQRA